MDIFLVLFCSVFKKKKKKKRQYSQPAGPEVLFCQPSHKMLRGTKMGGAGGGGKGDTGMDTAPQAVSR